jgi:PAS domain S-box-containing protein
MTSETALEELRRLAGPVFTALGRSGTSVVVVDRRLPDDPIVFVNEAFTTLTGYAPQEVLGRNCRLLQGEGTDRSAVADIRAALHRGEQVEAEILNYRKDGSTFWNSMLILPIPDDREAPAFFLATQTDVTAAQESRSMRAELRSRRQELEEARERLRLMLAVSGAAASWEWHIAASRIVGDLRFATLYGITPEEAAAGVDPRTFFSIIHPDDQARIRLAVGGMLRGAEVFSKEYRLLLGDGSVRWVHARGRCHFEEGRPVRFGGVLVDITEQKRSQERLRIAQTAGGVGTFEYVVGFGTVAVSGQFCSVLGLHPARDLPVRTINALVHPGDTPIIELSAHAGAGTVSHTELRFIRAHDGKERWLARRGEYLRDSETADLRFSGVIYDITEAKQSEEQLRTLNETLEVRVAERTRERDRIWKASRDLYVLCTRKGLCLSANPAWSGELGHEPSTLLGRRLHAFIHPGDHASLDAAIERLMARDRVDDLDIRVLAASGEVRTFSWTFILDGDTFFAAGRDVTQRNELEERLRHSQKMEAVGQLTGGLAHDFNNLLTGITGNLELTKLRAAQGRFADLERYVTAAQSAASRAAALTHRLLAFARRQTLDPRPVQTNRLVTDMEELIQRTVGPAIQLEAELAEDLWPTLCDPNQLENALLNLCINGRDAMPDGGRLTIRTVNTALDDSSAREQDMPPGEFVAISVTDTGTGMTPEVAERAFDPFFTTKPVGMGTGLGLSMIYGFARQSGGQVRIHSRQGQGTTVRIHLPRYAGEVEAEGPQPEPVEAPRARAGETVLVVDDEPAVRMLVTEVLEGLGYAALEAADGPSGLKLLQSGARIDLLVTDVGLPGGMNGRQMADAARAGRPELKVLFITGYAANAAVGSGHLPVGMHVMTKPFSLDLLATRIRELITAS